MVFYLTILLEDVALPQQKLVKHFELPSTSHYGVLRRRGTGWVNGLNFYFITIKCNFGWTCDYSSI